MSDKSFGDHTNRNIVKNPLLSTAVTGLSIEDLTHNAVLLPVARNQGLIATQDHSGTQTHALEHSEHGIANFPSGDANSNIFPPNLQSNYQPYSTNPSQATKTVKPTENLTSTVSKASVKTEDDFDVNEYFARLQGTRYVSAPLNSLLKEDANANLEATEENLEEISLNEPEKPLDDVHQSLTADIAQNFSQLPTVLPQVASAVFSSFSNMLSYKREQTDVKLSSGYQEVQFQKPEDVGVPLMGVDNSGIREVAPPPKEPPIVGTSNYRITTKKKAYAHIPGLSSGETQVMPSYNPPTSQTQPSFFIPSSEVKDNTEKTIMPTYFVPTTEDKTELAVEATNFDNKVDNSNYNVFNPIPTDSVANIPIQEPAHNINIEQFTPVAEREVQPSHFGHNPNVPNAAIIPPPPMFSNLPRRDSQPSVGKTVLPPSVARRISANHPIIKPQAVQPAANFDNLFVPAPISDTSAQSKVPPMSAQSSASINMQAPSAFAKTDNAGSHLPPPTMFLAESSKTGTSASINLTSAPPTDSQLNTNIFQVPLSSAVDISTSAAGTKPPSLPPTANTNIFPPSSQPPVLPPSNTPAASVFPPSIPPVAQSQPANLPSPPTFFNPNTMQTQEPKESPFTLQNQPPTITSSFFENTPSEPPKAIPEPPKATGNLNYRMTKKRPQYYSGPIEGVGAISNNVKPIIPPVASSAFQGALFTPEQQAQTIEQNIVTPSIDQSTVPFDITKPTETYAPFDLAKPQEQSYVQPDYNTAFDLSRPTTEYYEQPKPEKQESKGFGIIGSLKSKLSSIDINKIQNSVTTFFDPAYNESKKEVSDNQNAQQGTAYNSQYGQYGQSQGNDFGVYVPDNPPHHYSYPAYQAPGYFQGHPQDSGNIYQNQGDSYAASSYYSPLSYDTQPQFSSANMNTQGYYPPNFSSNTQATIGNNVTIPTIDNSQVPFYSLPTRQDQTSNVVENQNLSAFMPNVYSEVNFKQSYFATETQTQGAKVEESDRKLSDSNSSNIQANEANITESSPKPEIPLTASITPVGTIPEAIDKTPTKNIETLIPGSSEIENKNNVLQDITMTEKKPENIIDDFSFDKNEAFDLPDPKTSVQSIDNFSTENKNIDFFQNIPKNASESADVVFDKFSFDYGKKDSDINQNLQQNVLDTNPLLVKESDHVPLIYSSTENKAIGMFPLPKDSEAKPNVFDSFSFDSNILQNKDYVNPEPIEKIIPDPNIPIGVSNIPLFDLSNILAAKSKEMSELENDMKNVTLTEQTQNTDLFGQNSGLFGQIGSIGTSALYNQDDDATELNICETCREVAKPDKHEEKEVEDLTSQLIENITAPIQLLNPVEVPLPESNTPKKQDVEFDSNQFAEISQITEETIETIQIQSVAELLEDDIDIPKVSNYGWRTEEALPVLPGTEALLEHNYSFQLNTDPIGFYGKNSLFFDNIPNNASDEIKAEFKSCVEDVPLILPRQMSIPTAPPAEAEDDSKSDETGILDVHSIEQDAKKDFPIYEDFVIEPSETDDDKIEIIERERSSEDPISEIDTFTNRVERFKKMEETTTDVDEVFDSKSSSVFNLTASPAITIASYFDTGNYAAETHYRKSLTSPSTINSFQVGSSNIRIPPGFEEEYEKKRTNITTQSFSVLGINKNENVPSVPETSTQTRSTPTITFSSNSKFEENLSISPKIEEQSTECLKEDPPQKLPDFASVFSKEETKLPDLSNIFNKGDDKVEEPLEEKNVSLFGDVIAKEPLKQEPQKLESLPDPINFFGSSSETSQAPDEGFNRLASYFASPAKTDHSKSFFELSQSQNHYRRDNTQNIAQIKNVESQATDKNDHKSFFDLSQSQNHYMDGNIHNLPHDKYIANLELMKDLTSYQNIEIKEQIVRTVNYFTIEYNNDSIKTELIGEPQSIKNIDKPIKNVVSELEAAEVSDKNFDVIIKSCEYCCNIGNLKGSGVDIKDFKVRKVMDGNSEQKRESDGSVDVTRDNNNMSVTVNFDNYSLQDEANEGVAALTENRSSGEYSPVKHHWFYRVDEDDKSIWRGFSVTDSRALEDAYQSPDLNETTVVATDGGRFDVNVVGRLRVAVYWSDKPTNVRRCSWFYKGATDARYVPYTEQVAEKLEEEYRHGVTTGEWHRRLTLPNNELVVMHGPAVMVHFLQTAPTDPFSSPTLFTFGKRVYRNPPKIRVARDQRETIDHLILLVHGAGEYRSQKEKIQSTMRPRVVRRGCDESEIEDLEPSSIDHLLLLCHGVGSACDMRMRPVEAVVNDFRVTSLQLLQSHYRNSYDNGVVNRVEVLPISWHSTLHSGETGVDRRLAQVTLESIPRLRNFTNDTVLDVLFYTSPVFCQTIIDTVCREMNRVYKLFKERNPNFKGGVSLGGHSLGSVILYDLLCHQRPSNQMSPGADKQYVKGSAGTGQPNVNYPQLDFNPSALYALGSPIAIFETIRGVESLGLNFCLPTCRNFFNIFHPYDPIAYRIEPLVNVQLKNAKPQQIPHHKGRKRMHLELKDTMARVGADIKQKLIESIKSTWTSMWKTQPPPNDRQLEKVVEEEMEKEQLCDEKEENSADNNDVVSPDMLGRLNNGRRVDYVLQEAPFEMINEYIFAMSSHVCYWESEDTMLLMLREIYDSMGVQADCTVPQQSMTVQRSRTRQDETIIMNATEHPSTSRGGT